MPLTVYNSYPFSSETNFSQQVTLVSDEGEPYDEFCKVIERIYRNRISILSISYTNIDAIIIVHDSRDNWGSLI